MALLKVGDRVRVAMRRIDRAETERVMFRSGCTVAAIREGFVHVALPPRRDKKNRPHTQYAWVAIDDVTRESDIDDNRPGRS